MNGLIKTYSIRFSWIQVTDDNYNKLGATHLDCFVYHLVSNTGSKSFIIAKIKGRGGIQRTNSWKWNNTEIRKSVLCQYSTSLRYILSIMTNTVNRFFVTNLFVKHIPFSQYCFKFWFYVLLHQTSMIVLTTHVLMVRLVWMASTVTHVTA